MEVNPLHLAEVPQFLRQAACKEQPAIDHNHHTTPVGSSCVEKCVRADAVDVYHIGRGLNPKSILPHCAWLRVRHQSTPYFQ